MTGGKNPNWEKVRVRLEGLVLKRGVQAEISEKFGVSRAAVSQWVSGKRVPSAEIALALQTWVPGAKAKKQNAPGSARNTAGSGTLKRNNSDEIPKKSPPK